MTTKAKIIVLDLFENYLNGKLLYVEGIDKNKKSQYTLPDYILVFAKLYIFGCNDDIARDVLRKFHQNLNGK